MTRNVSSNVSSIEMLSATGRPASSVSSRQLAQRALLVRRARMDMGMGESGTKSLFTPVLMQALKKDVAAAPMRRDQGRQLRRSVPQSPAAFADLIEQARNRYRLPEGLLQGVIKAESNFNPNAVSPAGAKGLMQLMDATARSLGVKDSFDPVQNINGGARFLRQMLDRYGGDVRKALAAYNAGPGAVDRYGGIPPYQETKTYVSRVLGYLAQT